MTEEIEILPENTEDSENESLESLETPKETKNRSIAYNSENIKNYIPKLKKPIWYKPDLVREISSRTGYAQRPIEEIINAIRDIVEDSIFLRFPMRFFTIFDIRYSVLPEREGVNPKKTIQTGKTVREVFPKTFRLKFRASRILRLMNKYSNQNVNESLLNSFDKEFKDDDEEE